MSVQDKARRLLEAIGDKRWQAFTTGEAGGDHWHVLEDGQAIAHISANDGTDEELRQPRAEFIAAAPKLVRELLAEDEKWRLYARSNLEWAERVERRANDLDEEVDRLRDEIDQLKQSTAVVGGLYRSAESDVTQIMAAITELTHHGDLTPAGKRVLTRIIGGEG